MARPLSAHFRDVYPHSGVQTARVIRTRRSISSSYLILCAVTTTPTPCPTPVPPLPSRAAPPVRLPRLPSSFPVTGAFSCSVSPSRDRPIPAVPLPCRPLRSCTGRRSRPPSSQSVSHPTGSRPVSASIATRAAALTWSSHSFLVLPVLPGALSKPLQAHTALTAPPAAATSPRRLAHTVLILCCVTPPPRCRCTPPRGPRRPCTALPAWCPACGCSASRRRQQRPGCP